MSILQEILRHKREELKQQKGRFSIAELKARIKDAPPAKNFKVSIKRGTKEPTTKWSIPIKLIAEIKKASPSKGVIRTDFNLTEIASVYDRKNTSAISVLTDERFFQGSLDNLKRVRQLTGKPLLRKDFILDDYQVYESRVSGADAILLIVAALDRHQLSDLQALAKELSLDCLVEIHNLNELDTALYSKADIIGINNRDLNTMKISLDTTFELLKNIPHDKITVSESGINTREDVKSLEISRVDAILVGTAIIKAGDMGAKIDELLGEKGDVK